MTIPVTPMVAAAPLSATVAAAFSDTITLGSAIIIGLATAAGAVVAVMRFGRSSWRDQAEGLEKELTRERQERITEQGEHAAELAGYEKRSELLREQLLAERQKNHTLEKASDIIKLVEEQRASSAALVDAIKEGQDAQGRTLLNAIQAMLDAPERRQALGVDEALADARKGHQQIMARLSESEERLASLMVSHGEVLREIAKDMRQVAHALTTTKKGASP